MPANVCHVRIGHTAKGLELPMTIPTAVQDRQQWFRPPPTSYPLRPLSQATCLATTKSCFRIERVSQVPWATRKLEFGDRSGDCLCRLPSFAWGSSRATALPRLHLCNFVMFFWVLALPGPPWWLSPPRLNSLLPSFPCFAHTPFLPCYPCTSFAWSTCAGLLS